MDEKLRNTTLLRNNVSLLSGLQRNALASLVCFVTYTTKRTRDASALRWRPERRLTLFRSRVVFLSFSSLPCFCTFYSSIPTRNEVFFRHFFPLVSVLFGGGGGGGRVSKPTFKIQLVSTPIRYHTADDVLIASNEIASATHLRTRHHTAEKRVHRYRRTRFVLHGPETYTFGAGDERVSRWRQTSWKRTFELQLHTHS